VAGELRTARSGEGAPDGGETRPRSGSSAAALLGLFPLFVVLGALIKLASAGPVFFAQRRVGHQGRIITMLKFRSMVLNAEELKPRFAAQNESNGPLFKMKRDIESDGLDAGDGDSSGIARCHVDLARTTRKQGLGKGSAESTIRARDESDRVLNFHGFTCVVFR
jgi:hypothetical protein